MPAGPVRGSATSAAIAAFAVLGAGTLTGCSATDRATAPDAAAVSKPSRTTQTPSPDRRGAPAALVPDAVARRLPLPARSATPAGSEAFVRHYVTSINTAFAQPNATALTQLSTPDCDVCVALQARAAEFETLGQHYAGPIYRTTATQASAEQGGQRVVVDLEQLAVATLDRTGRVIDQNLASRARFSVSLRFTNAWQITRWQKIEVGSA